MLCVRQSIFLVASMTATAAAAAISTRNVPAQPNLSYGNYKILSANIDQYPLSPDNVTINQNFAIITQGTHDGSLPVECGHMWNVTAPTPQEQLTCTDPAVEVVIRQMHTSPEYGFELFVMLK